MPLFAGSYSYKADQIYQEISRRWRDKDHRQHSSVQRPEAHAYVRFWVDLGGADNSKKMKHKSEGWPNTCIDIYIRCFCRLMKCLGMFFVRPKGQKLFRRRFLRHITSLQLYCVVVLVIGICLILRSLLVFGQGSNKSGYRLFLKVYNNNVIGHAIVLIYTIFCLTCRFAIWRDLLQMFWAIYWYDCAMRQWYILRISWPKKNNIQALFLDFESRCFSDSLIPYERYSCEASTVERICRWESFFAWIWNFCIFVHSLIFCRALKMQMLYGLVYVLLQILLTGGLVCWGLYGVSLEVTCLLKCY